MKNICILGGGTAGFCTAAVLSRWVKNNNLDIEITCVYSSAIGNIGVGESTQLAINDIFQFLRLRDKDWMPNVMQLIRVTLDLRDGLMKYSIILSEIFLVMM